MYNTKCEEFMLYGIIFLHLTILNLLPMMFDATYIYFSNVILIMFKISGVIVASLGLRATNVHVIKTYRCLIFLIWIPIGVISLLNIFKYFSSLENNILIILLIIIVAVSSIVIIVLQACLSSVICKIRRNEE